MEENKKDSESPKLGILPRRFTMTLFFIICYTVIHVIFEFNFFITGDNFGKYAEASGNLSEIEIANRVYYTKAIWMFVLVWLIVVGIPFRSSMAYSFMLYSIALMVLLPFRIYAILNFLLAIGMIIEDIIDRLKVRRKEKI